MTRDAEWLIEVSPGETRAALVDGDGTLVALEVERMGRQELVDSIHLGRVTRVDAGIGAAFVEFGDAQPGFLGKLKTATEGEKLVVQVLRAAGGGKGALLTAAPVLVGHRLSLHPARPGVHWPRDWHGDKAALAGVLERIAPDGMGLSPRPGAAGAAEDTLRAEAERLSAAWQDVLETAKSAKPPALLLPAPDLCTRVLREAAGPVRIDHPETHVRLRKAAPPDLKGALALYKGQAPLFEEFCVEEQIEAALATHVEMQGGAGLVIEETEALTAIDVNMGGSGGRLPSEAAILKANQAAARIAARQIRLRNIGGLVVVDFISMRNKGNRRTVVEAMRREMRSDPVRHDVLGMTPAGLVEITRQRVGRPLAALHHRPRQEAPKPLPEAEACAALRAALRRAWTGKPALVAAPEVIAALQGTLAPALDEVNRRLGQALELREEPGREGFEFLSG
jgi:Rne/Rng family ribonuclease